jgi:hypothetical protein
MPREELGAVALPDSRLLPYSQVTIHPKNTNPWKKCFYSGIFFY